MVYIKDYWRPEGEEKDLLDPWREECSQYSQILLWEWCVYQVLENNISEEVGDDTEEVDNDSQKVNDDS